LRARLEWGPAAAADLLRPSAEEARPDERTSDALCHATAPKDADSTPLFSRRPLRDSRVLRGGLRHARSAGSAVGLERRCRTDQSAFHRIDPDLAARAGSTTFVFTLARLHPAPCRLPRAWPTSSKDGGSLQAIPRSPGLPRGAPNVATERCVSRLLQPTYDTSTLRIHRFPGGPSGHPGGASLDGDPPASALSQPFRGGARGFGP